LNKSDLEQDSDIDLEISFDISSNLQPITEDQEVEKFTTRPTYLQINPNSNLLTPITTPLSEVGEFFTQDFSVENIFNTSKSDSFEEEVQSQNSENFESLNNSNSSSKSEPIMTTTIPTIELPPFIENQVPVWLNMVKAKLKYSGVSDDDYAKTIRKNIPWEIVVKVPEVLEEPPIIQGKKTDTFEHIAKQIEDAFSKPRVEQIKQLLNDCSMEGRTPKTLMEEMIRLAKDDIPPILIVEIFKNKLPKKSIKSIVELGYDLDVDSKEKLLDMANIADRSYKFDKENPSPNKNVYSVSSSSSEEKIWKEIKTLKNNQNQMNNTLNGLVIAVNALRSQIPQNFIPNQQSQNFTTQNVPNQNFAAQNVKSQQNNNSNSQNGERRSRNRSKSPYKKIDRTLPENEGRCSWHIRYGENAYHCTLPCRDSGKVLKTKPVKTQEPAAQAN